jgi:DNA replication and repair protein RecF
MIIKKLKLENWRNYYQTEICFDEKINLIHGANAQGKTNLLEAISYLGLASSFRNSQETDLINNDQQYFYLEAELLSQIKGKITISAAMDRSKKRKWLVNHQPSHRLLDIIGIFHTVVFSPEDIYLVKGSPQLRRRWLNRQISQIDPLYCRQLLVYNQVLKQRNACLKNWQQHSDDEALAIWDQQLVDSGSRICQQRNQSIKDLNQLAKELHQELSGGEELSLFYQNSIAAREEIADIEQLAQKFAAELAARAEAERFRGLTLVGPHRDDIGILLNQLPARDFASQGQQRTLAISLKLSELELAYKHKGEYPVLLLDDVLSELDGQRRQRILRLPEQIQTFITAAIDDLPLNTGKKLLVKAKDGIARIIV